MLDDAERIRLDQQLRQKFLADIEVSKAPGKYNPTRFRRMLDQLGAVGTAKELLRSGSVISPDSGLQTLWMRAREGTWPNALAYSLEAVVLQQPYCQLFTDDERKAAWSRLNQLKWPDLPSDWMCG